MSPAEALRAARAMIDTPEKWTKGAYAKDASGCQVGFGSNEATCRCARGAVAAVLPWEQHKAVEALLNDACPDGFVVGQSQMRFVIYNDHPDTTHGDVMALFDRAIALAEAAA